MSRRQRSRTRFDDVRSGRVVFLSHCLLNQNTRYSGGAVCPGAVREAIEPYLSSGVGLVQMPCPEQQTWGGVEKRALLWLADHPRAARMAAVSTGPASTYLRWRYRRVARGVVRDIADYLESGFEVTDIVGVAGSPSCGVGTTLDIACALRAIGGKRTEPSAAARLNRAVQAGEIAGAGLFIDALNSELDRAGLTVSIEEITLDAAPAAHEC